tara:strand:+ start:597 stop:839 length:243 start_codon:yes stop_codon:yes gene_type:complete
MLVDGHNYLPLATAAPMLGMSTRELREQLRRSQHGMTVHEHIGDGGRVRRYLRADEVVAATGGADGKLLRQTAQTARGGR